GEGRSDDVGSIAEVTRRRFYRLRKERDEAEREELDGTAAGAPRGGAGATRACRAGQAPPPRPPPRTSP
uniref:hypothetical protein n=1 Tax=Nocardia farcinica TaxID=37329 RepID=UPI00245391E9